MQYFDFFKCDIVRYQAYIYQKNIKTIENGMQLQQMLQAIELVVGENILKIEHELCKKMMFKRDRSWNLFVPGENVWT